jgi:hypothetical protein
VLEAPNKPPQIKIQPNKEIKYNIQNNDGQNEDSRTAARTLLFENSNIYSSYLFFLIFVNLIKL